MALFTEIFEDVTKKGRKLPTSSYKDVGQYAIVDQGQNDIAGYTDETDGLFTDVPAIVFGDHTRVIKYIDFPCFLGADGVKLLKAKINNPNYKYLFYALSYADIPNTGYNRHFKWLKEVDIKLPDEVEQNDIVENLDKVYKLIELHQQQLSKLDELVKSRFIELFGDPTTNPMGHPVKELHEIAEYFNGLTYKPENVSATGTVVLRSSNIQNSELDFEDTVRVDCPIRDKLWVKENDILMCSRNGSARLVGKVALIKGLTEPMSFGAFMMIIRSPYYQYLMTFFQMDAFRQQIKTGATTTINQITGRMLDDVMLPIPDMEAVSAFSAFVEQTDKLKLAVKESLEKLETLKKSLMQEYFG